MPLETDADRLASLQAVGEQVTVAGATVWALWAAPAIEALGAMSTGQVLQLRTTDAAGVTTATQVVRNGVTYRVANIEADGTGYTRLNLQRAA
jgi:TusA-related sulfurtransferase